MQTDDTIATRASLLGRLKDREDLASWQEFFDTYWRLIYTVATKAGLSEEEAQEVVQDTVLSVANKVGEFRYDPKVCSFKTWMLRITRWRIIDRIRRRDREVAALGHRVHRRDVEPSPNLPERLPDEEPDRTATLDRLPDPAGVDLGKIWEEEWQQNLFAAALESLRNRIKPEQFQIFHLCTVKQLPVTQVARIAGVSIASVYVVKHRVATLLKEEVRRLESTMTEPGSDSPGS